MKTIFLPGVERPVSQLCLGTAYLGHREDDETFSRSGLDYVDFYLLHLDDPTVPVGEIMDALYEIRRRPAVCRSALV